MIVAFVCISIAVLGKLGGFVYGEEKNPKPRPKPRIEQLGKILFLEIVSENEDNIPKELLPTGVKKIKTVVTPDHIRYNEKAKKVVFVEPPHFTTLIRKEQKYTYKALIKRVFKGSGPKSDLPPIKRTQRKGGHEYSKSVKCVQGGRYGRAEEMGIRGRS